MPIAILLPQRFELNRGFGQSGRPKQGHHLSKHPHAGSIQRGAAQQPIGKTIEKALVWLVFDHEAGEDGCRIESYKSILADRAVQIDSEPDQPKPEDPQMLWSSDHDRGLAGIQAGAHVARQGIKERGIIQVKLGKVLAGGNFAPEDPSLS